MPTLGGFIQALDPSSPRKRPASRLRNFGDLVQSMDPSAPSPGLPRPKAPVSAAPAASPVPSQPPSPFLPVGQGMPPPPPPGYHDQPQQHFTSIQKPQLPPLPSPTAPVQQPFSTAGVPDLNVFRHSPEAQAFKGQVMNTALGGMPQQVGLLAGVNQAIANGPQGPSYASRLQSGTAAPSVDGPMNNPMRTFGGAFGNPGGFDAEKALTGRQMLEAARGNQYAVTGNPGLGLAPRNEEDFTRQMDQQNMRGNLFGGTLPTLVSAPSGGVRPGFLDSPAVPNPQKPQFPSSEYRTIESGPQAGALTPRSASYGMGAMSPEQKKKLSEGRQDYLEKRQGVTDQRKAGVLAKAQTRSEARRARRGLFTPEEQLNRANPAAYQARAAEEARANAFAENAAADRGVREKLGMAAVEQRDRSDKARIRAAEIEAGLQPGGQEKPVSPFDVKSGDYANLSPQERQAELAKLPQATRDRIQDELTRKGWLTRMLTGLDQPGQAPISGVKNPSWAPGPVGNLIERGIKASINTPRINFSTKGGVDKVPASKLKDQPGDTPAQKRIRAELRAKRST